MIFVTADSRRDRLEGLTKLLVSLFPGSTVYQHTDPVHASADALKNRVDAVFLAADREDMGGIELVEPLRRQKKGMPVFILSDGEQLRSEAMEAGAAGFFAYPLSGQMLKEALLASGNRGGNRN